MAGDTTAHLKDRLPHLWGCFLLSGSTTSSVLFTISHFPPTFLGSNLWLFCSPLLIVLVAAQVLKRSNFGEKTGKPQQESSFPWHLLPQSGWRYPRLTLLRHRLLYKKKKKQDTKRDETPKPQSLLGKILRNHCK